VNEQNFRCWASGSPPALHDRPVYIEKADVRCAVGSMGAHPLFFFNDDGAAVTVNAECYIQMLTDYLIPSYSNVRFMWETCGFN